MTGYYVKFRESREIQNPEQVTMKNGWPATRGSCGVFDTGIYKMGCQERLNRPVEKVEAQSVPIQNRNLLERWHTRFVQSVRLRRHAATNAVTDTSSPQHYPDNIATGSGALAGSGGPAKLSRRRTAFFRLCANDDMYPSQSTFHSPRNLLLAQPNRSCDANTPSAIVFPPEHLRLVRFPLITLLRLKMQGVKYAQRHIPAHLSGRQTFGLYWTPLAVMLARDILTGSISLHERAPAQHLALRTYEVIPTIVEAPLGYHVPRLVRMEGNVGSYAHIVQALSQDPRSVRSVSREGFWLDRQLPQHPIHCLPFTSLACVALRATMKPPRSTITFSW